MKSTPQPVATRLRFVTVTLSMIAAVVIITAARQTVFEGTLWVLVFVPVGVTTIRAGWRWGAAVATVALVMPLLLARVDAPETALPPGGLAELIARGAFLAVAIGALARLHSTSAGVEPTVRLDSSTGLATSRVLYDQVAAEIERARRYTRPFTIAYIAIENIAALRQRHGEHVAEEALRRITHQIRASLRSVDLVARLRDREFAVLLPETGSDSAQIVLGRIESLLSVSLAQEVQPLAFAIGAITWVRSGLDAQALHQRAYQQMYAARREERAVKYEVLDEHNLEEVQSQHLITPRAAPPEVPPERTA